MTEKQKRQGFFLVFGFKVSFKHGFKGCLIPQDLCVPQRLCFWYLSNFALMGCSLFAFYMYISMRKTEMWIWISYLCVSWLKWLIYDSSIRILVSGNGVCLILSLGSYLFSKFWFLLQLRSMGSS